MKKIFSISVLVALSLMANAQSTKLQHHFTAKNVQAALKHRFLKNVDTHPLQKTTTTKLRVIAEAQYDMQAWPINKTDSVHYKYFGSLGSTYYPMQRTYASNYPPFLIMGGDGEDYSTVNASADSVKLWTYDSTTASLKIVDEIAASFLGSGDINTYEEKISGAYPYHSRYSNTYNTQGQLKQILGFEYDTIAHVWDSSEKYIYTYDTQGKILRDSLYTWDSDEEDWELFAIIKHIYDANGKQKQTDFTVNAGTSFQTVFRGVFTFYPNGKSKTFIFYQNQGSGLQPISKDSSAYTTGIDFSTERWEYEPDNSLWKASSHTIITLNSQNLPDSIITENWDTTNHIYVKSDATVYTHNQDKLIAQWSDYLYAPNSGQMVLLNSRYFYYENFTPNAIKEPIFNANIRLYPNPATNTLNLQWQEGNSKQVAIQITNALGQVMLSKKQTWTSNDVALPIDMLSVGSYFITIRDESGAAIFASPFIKK